VKAAKVSQGKFTVILRKEQDGGYTVQCIELPGAISEGDTKKEALSNIREAIQGYLEAFPEEEERLKLEKEVLQVTI
jgi:predicted RNase H-like HicB family nuclease